MLTASPAGCGDDAEAGREAPHAVIQGEERLGKRTTVICKTPPTLSYLSPLSQRAVLLTYICQLLERNILFYFAMSVRYIG